MIKLGDTILTMRKFSQTKSNVTALPDCGVFRDVGGADNLERITIKLEADNKSICVESLQAGAGERIIRSSINNCSIS